MNIITGGAALAKPLFDSVDLQELMSTKGKEKQASNTPTKPVKDLTDMDKDTE